MSKERTARHAADASRPTAIRVRRMVPLGPRGADRGRGRLRMSGSLVHSPQVLVTIQVVFVQLFTTGVFFVLAPLVGPRAFGLLALVMVLIGFCETVLTGVTVEALLSVLDID